MDEHNSKRTLLLKRSEVASLLSLDACINAVEQAFRLHGQGLTADPAVAGVHTNAGGFHVKAGLLNLGDRPYFAAKTNANFMENRVRFGLPTIQGIIGLSDAENGFPLAVMDSIEVSILRTGAATAVAAKHLARQDSSSVAICGCGEQGRVQLRALSQVLPIKTAEVWDIDEETAQRLAKDLGDELGISISVAQNFRTAAANADVCVTCTPSHEFILFPQDIRPGTFVAGVGVDNPHKKELSPDLMASGKVVVDVLGQAATIGDLHHAIESGAMGKANVHSELGNVAAGNKPGRTTPEEITIFDSTGMALQDVATAALVYERALEAGVGQHILFGS